MRFHFQNTQDKNSFHLIMIKLRSELKILGLHMVQVQMSRKRQTTSIKIKIAYINKDLNCVHVAIKSKGEVNNHIKVADYREDVLYK